MDEVKRWDLNQLPGFEAVEEPEKESEEDILEKINELQNLIIKQKIM